MKKIDKELFLGKAHLLVAPRDMEELVDKINEIIDYINANKPLP